MKRFLKVLRAELMKVRWSLVVPILLAAPVLAFLMRGKPAGAKGFEGYYMGVVVVYGWIFYPIVSGILAGLVCRTEHAAGGWKQLLALPVRRSHVYLAKYAIVAALLAVSQVLVFAGIVVFARISGVAEIPWHDAVMGMLGGWLAVLPLAALQLWASSRWRAFGGPLALNVVLTFPAIFAVQSDKFAPFYPWGLPVVGMMQSFSKIVDNQWAGFSATTFFGVIVTGFVVWLGAGLVSFARADVA